MHYVGMTWYCLRMELIECVDCGTAFSVKDRRGAPCRCQPCKAKRKKVVAAANARKQRALNPDRDRARRALQIAGTDPCTLPECERPGLYLHDGNRVCNMHHSRMQRHGTYDLVPDMLVTITCKHCGEVKQVKHGTRNTRKTCYDCEALHGSDKLYQMLSRYGVTATWYAVKLAEQGDACAICRGPWGAKGPCIDHNHVTGKARGLLCFQCNVALGAAKDNVHTLRSAIEYLNG